jgi:hypothetical protein
VSLAKSCAQIITMLAIGCSLMQAQTNPAPPASAPNYNPNAAFVGNLHPPPPSLPTGPAPRNVDGTPDLSGNWNPVTAIQFNLNLAAGGVQVPFQPWAEKLYNERVAGHGKDDPEAFCLPPGTPRLDTTPYPFRIIQTPGLIAILYEGGTHAWREIYMDGRPHNKNVEETWIGDSIGKWDGDSLVVDTVGFNDKTWLDAAGHPHTDALHVIERFHRTDVSHLDIEMTIDDPKTYTKPWTVKITVLPLKGELLEYICNENNKDVEHLR